MEISVGMSRGEDSDYWSGDGGNQVGELRSCTRNVQIVRTDIVRMVWREKVGVRQGRRRQTGSVNDMEIRLESSARSGVRGK
jgi:hypothetical protein